MRILAVYPYIPWPLNRGAYYRAYYLLKGLAQFHEVDLLALAENGEGMEHRAVFTEFCGRVELRSFQHPAWPKLIPGRLFNQLPSTISHWSVEPLRAGIAKMLAEGRYDAVHVEDIVVAQDFLRTHRTIPLVVDRTRVDLQYQLMEAARMRPSWKQRLLNIENQAKLWAYEKAVARRSSLQVLCGPDDETFVRRYVSEKVPISVIPNGVDLDYFHPSKCDTKPAGTPTVMFCGAMDYIPNVDALRWFFGEIHSKLRKNVPNLQVLIVGKDPTEEVKAYTQRPGVTVTGAVPDVRPFYRQAWAQIVPLRIGGGTRLKIAESLGIGTPVVSTTIGAQGLFLKHDEEILLADSAESFVKETTRILEDRMLRERIARGGLAAAQARLAWPALGRRLAQSYSEHVFDTSVNRMTLTREAGREVAV